MLPLLGATFAYYCGLGWLKLARREANRGDCGEMPRQPRPYATIPADEEPGAGDWWDEFPGSWCPIHAHEYWGMDCPICSEGEWDLDDRAELGPEPWFTGAAPIDYADPFRPEGGW